MSFCPLIQRERGQAAGLVQAPPQQDLLGLTQAQEVPAAAPAPLQQGQGRAHGLRQGEGGGLG